VVPAVHHSRRLASAGPTCALVFRITIPGLVAYFHIAELELYDAVGQRIQNTSITVTLSTTYNRDGEYNPGNLCVDGKQRWLACS
jgi:hypothetical protein